jgi:cytoskeleton-associated protein 5
LLSLLPGLYSYVTRMENDRNNKQVFRTTVAESDPSFRPYLLDPSPIQKALTDSNAVAQEKGVELACIFIEFGGRNAALKSRELLALGAVEKCLGSSRAGTKTKAVELLMLLVETEDSADGVVEALIGGLKAKQPKAVQGCVLALKELVR